MIRKSISSTVSARAITRRDFFFVEADDYDEHIELAIPFYIQMHEELLHCAPERDGFRVLDLGCGTGKTADVFLRHFATSTVVGIDLFEEMLKHARERLAEFGNRVQFRQGDFRSTEFGSGFDVCASALAIHHLTAMEKQDLFRRVYDSLVPAGKFLMIDWTKFKSRAVQDTAADVAEHHVAREVSNQAIVDAWISHWREKNIPETVEDLKSWLQDAGFEDVECVVRYYGLALITATKK